jgi:hypothetical protein
VGNRFVWKAVFCYGSKYTTEGVRLFHMELMARRAIVPGEHDKRSTGRMKKAEQKFLRKILKI